MRHFSRLLRGDERGLDIDSSIYAIIDRKIAIVRVLE